MKEHFVLQYPNGSLVGIDHHSGGYPWEAVKGPDSFVGSMMTWPTVEAAEEYAKHFDGSTYLNGESFSVKRFVWYIEDVSRETV